MHTPTWAYATCVQVFTEARQGAASLEFKFAGSLKCLAWVLGIELRTLGRAASSSRLLSHHPSSPFYSVILTLESNYLPVCPFTLAMLQGTTLAEYPQGIQWLREISIKKFTVSINNHLVLVSYRSILWTLLFPYFLKHSKCLGKTSPLSCALLCRSSNRNFICSFLEFARFCNVFSSASRRGTSFGGFNVRMWTSFGA